MRFAVHGPGIPAASPRSHGVPRRDVPGRVHIRVASVSAGGAPEDGLARTRLRVHPPARRAPLAGERRRYLLDSAGCLLFQTPDQQTPLRPQDAPVESSLLADVPARVLPRAFRRSGHIPDLEVFHRDHVKPARDVCAGLLCPVFAPIRLTGAQPGDGQPYPATAVRAAPGAGKLAFQAPQPLPLRGAETDCVQQLASRQGRADNYSSINPGNLRVAGRWDGIWNRYECDMPPSGAVTRHSVGLHFGRYSAGPAESHPPRLRHTDLADVTGQAAYIPVLPASAHDTKSFVPAGFAPQRPPGRVLRIEEGGHRSGEVAQRLLLHRLRSCGQPWVLRAYGGELPTLLQVAGATLPPRAPVRVLLNGQVPHVPGVRAVIPQNCLLGGRGKHAVPRHTNIVATTTDISREVKRRYSPGLAAGISTSRSR